MASRRPFPALRALVDDMSVTLRSAMMSVRSTVVLATIPAKYSFRPTGVPGMSITT
nr:MAG TPA: hypothetical protein [Caudoviricetes sp.]DAQ21823.1 MAG TPA: hypothetical protein [Caudoviricetes sp.]